MSPRSRTVLTLSLLTVAGLILSAVLVLGALDRLRVRAAESNTDFVLTQLGDSIESSVSLGLALPDIRIAQDLVERARAGNPDILAVEIFAPDGLSIFNTDRGSVGEPITDTWREALRRRGSDGHWRAEEFGSIVVGEDIHNDFGEIVGEIAISLSGAARETHAEALVATLIPWFAIVALPAILVVALVAYWLMGYASRDFRQAARRLAGPPSPDKVSATPEPDDLEGSAQAMRDHVAREVDRVTAIAATVRALDEDEAQDAAA